MSQGSSPLTKNRKTFSGCWSCRERKIKCDEARPNCRQCMKSGLECKGYDVRLQWITNAQPDVEFPGSNNPRRNIVPDSDREVLPWDRIDEILSKLGQYDPRYRPALKENVQLSMDCFGVFRDFDYATAASPLHDESTPASLQIQDIIEVTDTTPSRAIKRGVDVQLYALNSPTSFDGQDGLISSPSIGIPSTGSFVTNSQTQLVQTPSYHYDREDENDALQDIEKHLATTSKSVYLGKTERFLMNYYSKRVVDLFCVIENRTSPWKTIHLPKAQRAVGQIILEGTTSRIREALVSSCLSISAFCLSNDCQLRLQRAEASKWEKLAYNFRLKAITLLRNAMEEDFYPKTRVKYKDFLVTTLSMITIDVMSGETDTCGIHLDGALRLIRHGLTWKRQYSSKAQCLHRIYFYLRAIFESTLPRDNLLHRRQLSSPTEQDEDSEDVFCHSIVAKYSSWSSPSILDRNLDPNIGSYESIYGVPYSLLFLLTQVIDLISKLYDEAFEGRIPAHLMDACDELEHSIMDWPTNVNFPPQPPASCSSSAKIVYHHTVAFHGALIIYFAQHVRLVGHRFLQPHIRAVLDSMEEIEKIKVETNLIAAPLYWPAFIASSEAFDKGLQERFRKWYEHVRHYGIEALRTGISVLEEVWETGPRRGDRVTSSWREVVEKSGLILMLS